ncbi:hypothetical protein IFM89_011729 [Coptis chinensis]|uniref:Uncharacterized protein n=1 Tax=Coptis chinensis TaxID=261450 RepID=A0A835IVG4_9MAGN|nr:hypothetical protein IFM89_011729 [Coptis chinensis]
MERFFGNAYRGDPGVPHTDPERFVNIWIGSVAFSAISWFHPYMWQLSNQYNEIYFSSLHFFPPYQKSICYTYFCCPLVVRFLSEKYLLCSWHDRAMLFEQHHWKKALKKGQPYQFKWNQYMDKDLRESYYFNWPVYFP